METLSIVIPVFNEVNTIKEIIEQVRAVHLPQIASREIVIVDDYSRTEHEISWSPTRIITLSRSSSTTGIAVRERPSGQE